MQASTYLNNALLDLCFGGTAFSARPSTLYFALFTSPPNAGGGGTEVNGAGYARSAYTASTGNFTSPGTPGDNIANVNAIEWPRATGSWGTVAAIGIYDAATSGNLLGFEAISSPVAVTSGQKPSIAAAGMAISLTGQFGNKLEQAILNHIFRAVAWPGFPTHYYAVGAGVTPAGLTTEASGGSYARKSMSNNKTTYGNAADSILANAAAIAFANATASWGVTADSWAIYDASSSGNCLWTGTLGTPVAISSGIYQFGIGEIVINLG